MGWRSQEYQCDACGERTMELVERGASAPTMECDPCGGKRYPVMSAPMVMNHTYPDGTKRFEGLKESRRLARAAAEAKIEGRRDDEKRLRAERKKVSET